MRFEDTPELTQTWLARPRPAPQATTRLICFHHAGGNPSNFRPWLPDLPNSVELLAVRLAGRDARMREAPATNIDAIVGPLAQAIAPLTAAGPVLFFGHSLGSLIAFETLRELRRTGASMPKAFVVSGRRAPGTGRALTLHTLPDDQFVREVQRIYGGIPAVIMQEPELLAMTIPVLRGDLTINETYSFVEEPPLEGLPIHAIGGTDDPHVIPTELQAWKAQTTGAFEWAQFDGDHFYLGTPAGRRWVIQRVARLARIAALSRR